MDRDLYQIMQEIKQKENENAQKYKKFEVEDVQYIGTIETIEKINNVDTKIVKDIFKVIEKMQDGSIVENYYDEQINCIAGRNQEGQMYPSEQQIGKDIDINEKIENLENNPGISLNEIDAQIKAIAKELGIEKEEILAMSQYDLDQQIENKDDNDEKIKLNDDEEQKEDEEKEDQEKEEQEEIIKQNETTLDNINAKQEIDLDKKVDDIHTLGQVLGVKPGSKLIAVYSNAVENNKNTTRFSFIIKNQDGTLENADMLNQAGGRDSNKNIYEINRDGSKVEEKSVQSSYAIDSPLIQNGLLTARVGEAGYIEISYGEMNKTYNKEALTHELKTDHTKDVTYRVREEFSYKKGTENIKEDLEEVKDKRKYGKEGLTLEDADGEKETGIQEDVKNMENSEYKQNIINQIKQFDSNIGEVFTDKEIEDRLQSVSEKNPNASLEEIIQLTKEDLSQDSTRMNHGHPPMEIDYKL